MALKAKKPELVVPSKPKFLISGVSGIGKTFFALSFPKPYLIDTEGGATRKQYQDRLQAAGGVYFGKEEGSQDFNSVINEVKSLATEKHEYKTLIIDSVTHIYLARAAQAELEIGSDFGRDKKEAQKPMRQLMAWLEKLDMTIILICHSKTKWVRHGKEVVDGGSTFDAYDKMEYILDLWVEVIRPADISGEGGMFKVRKSRIESLPIDRTYPLVYLNFAELYGKDTIEKESVPLNLATPEQLKKLTKLIDVLKIDEEQIQKWLSKIDVESFEEFTSEQIDDLIKSIEKKLETLKNGNGKE